MHRANAAQIIAGITAFALFGWGTWAAIKSATDETALDSSTIFTAPPPKASVDSACASPDPFVALAVHARGVDDTAHSLTPAIIARRSVGGNFVLATQGEVGAVYGLAFDHRRGHVYAGAYHRVGLPIGPGGLGQIYRIDLESGDITAWASLEAGEAPSDPLASAQLVGEIGLGDLEVSEDGAQLLVTNLSDRRIHRFALPGGAPLGSAVTGGSREAWREHARPFGLGVRDGQLYHGVVKARTDMTLEGILFEAWVYKSDLDGRNETGLMRTWLGYSRLVPWTPWVTDGSLKSEDAPMLVDIDFQPSGAPILGFRDRQSDMHPDCVWRPGCTGGASVGDIIPARRVEPVWRALTSPPFYGDAGAGGFDAVLGSLASIAGLELVAAPSLPLSGMPTGTSNGVDVIWFDNIGGRAAYGSPIFDASADDTLIDGHASAGDIEVLCGPPADPDAIAATATEAAAGPATETAAANASATAVAAIATTIGRATNHPATQTAHAPTHIARSTDAAATATMLAPTLQAGGPTRTAAATHAAETATAAAPSLKGIATRGAIELTRVAAEPTQHPGTPAAAGAAYRLMKSQCVGDNPHFVTTCFVPASDGRGNLYDEDWFLDQPVLVAFNDADPEDLSQHLMLAYEPQVGAVFGVGHDLEREQIYISAYNKRLAYLGPLGAGGIYRIDLPTGRVEPWAWLDAGLDPHDMGRGFDSSGGRWVGRTGLGDIEVTEDFRELVAVNMYDRLLYRFSIPDGKLLGAFPHGAVGEVWAEDARPFGLAVKDEWLYHGLVDSRETAADDDPRLLQAYVYRSRTDGTEMSEVARIDMSYSRVPAWEDWPERDEDEPVSPMLVDIAFRNDGDLVVGFRERRGDARILIAGGGDMVLTMRVGDRDGPEERYIALTSPEFYQDNIRHPESSWGTLTSLRWLDQVITTVIDPWEIWSGGAAWYDNVSGGIVRRETVYAGRDQSFGKTSGLGDLESLCEAPTPTPTFTATPPVSTTPSTASPTPTATSTATPTVSRTWTIYLPYGENLCVPEKRFVDVVLVLDRSTSMLRPVVEGGLAKNEAAIDAAARFIEELALEPDPTDPLGRHDNVALVGFNDTAWTESELTNNRPAAYAALERLRDKTVEGTRLDLAIAQGQVPLDGPGRGPGNQAVIVLLTDGLPNRVPFDASKGERQEDTVMRAAEAVKAAGSTVYTIGLGTPMDINPRLLISMATERFNYYYAPLPEALEGIYRIIADEFTFCGRERVPPPEPCIPEHVYADVMLVLDMSTSMRRTTRDGRLKSEAALEAAKRFVDELDLERDGWGRQDQVGIVGFNGTAWTETTLTDDRERIQLAFERLPDRMEEGTRLDLALREGLAAWHASGRIPENRPVMVFLTDGLPNQVPTPVPSGRQEDTVLAEAERVKAAGMRVFTIGLGLPDDVLRELLEGVASSPRDHYFAPDGEDLADIYRQIAGRLVECPREE